MDPDDGNLGLRLRWLSPSGEPNHIFLLFVANPKFIVFLLKHMKGTSPDTETDEVIRATVAKNLSDARHVGDTRKFVAEQMPHRQQRYGLPTRVTDIEQRLLIPSPFSVPPCVS